MQTQSVIKQLFFFDNAITDQIISSYRCTGNFSSSLVLKTLIYMLQQLVRPLMMNAI